MKIIEIKEVTLHNVLQLQKIGKTTFHETFSAFNSAENMDEYLHRGFSIDQLTIELNDTNSKFYFAELNNSIIGYLKLNFGYSQTELNDEKGLEIERIYVLKAYHGNNVGQTLYNKAVKVAQQKEVEYMWLGVWEKNLRAINFYSKNGFVEFDKYIFVLGNDQQTDIMMKLKII